MSDEKLCPFRTETKKVQNYAKLQSDAGMTPFEEVYLSQSSFLPCVREKCQMWRTAQGRMITPEKYEGTDIVGVVHVTEAVYEIIGYCGLAWKP